MDYTEIDQIISLLRKAKYPTEEQVRFVCAKGSEILSKLPNIVTVQPPVTVCGDTHGQLFDLFELFSIGGECPDTNYLFLGDYVDRGYYSLETFLLLLSLKIRYPNRMTLLRGNHESRQTTQAYGFYEEVMRKYKNSDVWDLINSVFDLLPLCAIIGGKIFCVHGGISRDMQTLDDIKNLSRPLDIPEKGFIADLLWADPSADFNGFQESERGTSFTFGSDAAEDFLEKYDFDLITRAHQVVQDGYEFPFYPQQSVVTVFSASNYCGEFGNKGAMLRIDEQLSCSFEFVEPDENYNETPAY